MDAKTISTFFLVIATYAASIALQQKELIVLIVQLLALIGIMWMSKLNIVPVVAFSVVATLGIWGAVDSGVMMFNHTENAIPLWLPTSCAIVGAAAWLMYNIK